MFEENISIDDSEAWEHSLIDKEGDGKLKFPVFFHDNLLDIGEIKDQMILSPPKKVETKVKIHDLNVKNKKSKSKLF